MVSPTAATHKRKKQLVGSKQVTKQNRAKVATNDDHDDDDDDKEELAPGEDKIRISILLPKCEINTRRELTGFF